MSHVPYYEVSGSRRSYFADGGNPVSHLLRLMLFFMSVLYATLGLIPHGDHKPTGDSFRVKNDTEQLSPLQVLLDKGQILEAQTL